MSLIFAILLVSALVIGGVVYGAAVQKVTYFLYPFDFITLASAAALAAMTAMWALGDPVLGIAGYWFAPFAAGYVAGYFVSGRTRYVMVRQFLPGKATTAEGWVLYYRDGRTCMQVQSNRELLKRLLFGVEHEVESNAPLEADWDDVTHYPLWIPFRRRFLMVEHWETVEIPPPRKRRVDPRTGLVTERDPLFHLRRYVTMVRVANGSMVSRTDLIRDARSLEIMQGQMIELNNEIFKLRQSLNIRMADTVAAFLADVYSKAPGASLSVSARRWTEKQRRKEKERETKAEE